MNYDRIGLQPLLRVVSDRLDWPESGLGWAMVPFSGDPLAVDCVIVSREGPVAELGALGVPMLVAPMAETPMALIDMGRGMVFLDDAPEAVARLMQRACLAETPGFRERGRAGADLGLVAGGGADC